MEYKIGSFNCLNFGFGSDKDIDKFVEILTEENFDIIALQEIKGQLALNRILRALPNYWKGIADSEVNDYAFIWNSFRVKLAESPTATGTRIYEPRIYKQYRIDKKSYQTDLVREPFFARFEPIRGPFIEFRLINTHVMFGKSKDSDDSNLPIGEIAMRRNEINILSNAIYAKEADKRYGNNRLSYTILLGDYNLNICAKSPKIEDKLIINDANDIKEIIHVQNELTTLKSNPQDENIFSNNYDHFSYDLLRFNTLGAAIHTYRINSVEKHYSGDHEKHRKDISDHVPIGLNLILK